jgi:hypothetical protein
LAPEEEEGFSKGRVQVRVPLWVHAYFATRKPKVNIHVITRYGVASRWARLLDRNAAIQDTGMEVRELFAELAYPQAQRRGRREVAEGDLGRKHTVPCCDGAETAI